MADPLFDRRIRVTLAKPVKGSFNKSEPNGFEVTALDMEFKIEKKLQKNPNTAQVVLYNLNESSRAFCEKKPLHVRLDAGYGTNIHRLWIGDMTFSSSRLDGTTWKTTIEIANGERAYNHARCNRSFQKASATSKTTNLDIINEVANAMEMSINTPQEVFDQLRNKAIQHAKAIRGPARNSLDKILKAEGLEWSIQDNVIQILKPEQLRSDQAHLINQSTGMVGSPEYNAPKKPGEKAVVKIRVLLHAGLVPGQKIKLESDSVTGVFRLEAVTHTGSTFSKEYYSDIEAKPI